MCMFTVIVSHLCTYVHGIYIVGNCQASGIESRRTEHDEATSRKRKERKTEGDDDDEERNKPKNQIIQCK
jgi:hypothetical protein